MYCHKTCEIQFLSLDAWNPKALFDTRKRLQDRKYITQPRQPPMIQQSLQGSPLCGTCNTTDSTYEKTRITDDAKRDHFSREEFRNGFVQVILLVRVIKCLQCPGRSRQPTFPGLTLQTHGMLYDLVMVSLSITHVRIPEIVNDLQSLPTIVLSST